MLKRALLLVLPLAFARADAIPLDPHTIRAVIGSGSHGDGGPATAALLDGPAGLAEDSQGNLYVAEANAGVIRRIRSDGTIERFAGTGVLADGAAGQPALKTDLISPSSLIATSGGTLLFADAGSCRIREIRTDGTIRDVAGTGRCSGTSAAFPGGGRVMDGLALQTDLGAVGGMTLDGSGRLVFSEAASNVVRRLDTDGYVRTIAGTGSAGFTGDDGKATDATFRSPAGVAYDSGGSLYIADSANCRIRRVDTDGNVTTVAGNGKCATPSGTFVGGGAGSTAIGMLAGMSYDSGRNAIVVAAPGQARVLLFDIAASWVLPIIGNGTNADTTSPPTYGLDSPSYVLPSSRGTLVSDSTSFRVLQLNNGSVGTLAGAWPQPDTYPSALSAPLLKPRGLCVAPDGSLIVADADTGRILSLREQLTAVAGARGPTGHSSGDSGPATAARIAAANRVACAPNGDLYISDAEAVRVVHGGVIRTALAIVSVGTTTSYISQPTGMAVDPAGRLLISETGAHRVLRFDPSARSVTVVAGTGKSGFSGDGGAATSAKLNSPGDLAFDSKGNLLIADSGNRRVRRVAEDGTIQTVAGSARGVWNSDTSGRLATEVGLDTIQGLAVDSSDNIYIAENLRISAVTADGKIYILTGYLGETDAGVKLYKDGPFNGGDGLAAGPNGRLYASMRDSGLVMVLASPADSIPAINEGGVVSASAFGASATASPGAWIEIYGVNLSATTRSWTAADFAGTQAPRSLDGTRVAVGGTDAFISYVSPTQVNAMIPAEVPAGSRQLTVNTAAGTSGPYTLTINQQQPGLLAPAAFAIGGRQYAAAVYPDGKTFVLPSGAIAGLASRPARPGDYITLYAIGFGSVTPAPGSGQIVQIPNSLDLPVEFFVDGMPAALTYRGLAPGVVGLYQFNLVVPSVAPGDSVPLTFTLGGVPGTQTLYTAVGN